MRSYRSAKNEQNHFELQSFRLSLLVACLIILSFVLILRMAYLQLSQYKRFATLSLKNQMSITAIAPPRGIIADRHGMVLAENIPVYVLEIVPERIQDVQSTLQELQSLIPSITNEDIENFNHIRNQFRSYAAIPFKLKLTEEEVAIFANNQYRFPGVSIKARLMRSYPHGEITAHLLGYVGRMNSQELQAVDSTNYRATNFIGKTGIEKYYENILHGQVGYQQIETDVSGRTLRTISKQNPIAGDKLYLTIDIRLQQQAHDALANKRGAAIILDINTGEVLAMVSQPGFNPNLFVNGISKKDYQNLSSSKDNPLYNRAVQGLYPPASTIKPFIAIAGLEHGVITPNSRVYDPGWYRLPGISHKYRDWRRTGHGFINLQRALVVSCDTYFYRLGHKLGISAIEDTLMTFGFGQRTHIDLLEEAAGIVPNPFWKQHSRSLPWYPGDTLITAIGQGFMLASPLQMANATAAIGLNGRRFRPHLLYKTVKDQGQESMVKPLEEYPIALKNTQHWRVITDAMQHVINSKEGTGHRFGHPSGYSIAAKTGTAQVFSGHQYEKKRYEEIPENLRDHSLFVAFAPADKPKIAIAVLVENDHSAPIVARKLADAYFNLISNTTNNHEYS